MSALLAPLAPWFAAAAGVVLAVLAAFARGKSAGREEEAQRAVKAALDNRRARDAVEIDVAREPDPVGRLRAEWSRD